MNTMKDFKNNSVKDFYTRTHGKHTQNKHYYGSIQKPTSEGDRCNSYLNGRVSHT